VAIIALLMAVRTVLMLIRPDEPARQGEPS